MRVPSGRSTYDVSPLRLAADDVVGKGIGLAADGLGPLAHGSGPHETERDGQTDSGAIAHRPIVARAGPVRDRSDQTERSARAVSVVVHQGPGRAA